MNCVLLSEHLIVEFLIYGAAGDCSNLGERLGKRGPNMNCEMLRTWLCDCLAWGKARS